MKNNFLKDGIEIYPDFFDANIIEEIDKKIVKFVQSIDLTSPSETEDYIVETPKSTKKLNFNQLAGAHKTVVKVRGDHPWDDGMLDIFHIDKVVDIDYVIKNKSLADKIRSIGKRIRNVNIYYNNSITVTRDYHRDSSGGVQCKAFIYLTDVLDESFGPYSYIKGTQTEATNEGEVVHCIANKGSLILSNQSGLHRGLPQAKGKSRHLISINLA